MTGWAGPGTNLPLSRITIGSLADLGYTVNYAPADAYTPTSAGLAAGRSASASSLPSSRSSLVGLMAGTTSVSPDSAVSKIDDSTNTNTLGSRRSASIAATQSPIVDPSLADSAMAEPTNQPSSATLQDGSFANEQETSSNVDQMWAELGQSWDLSSVYVLA